MGSKSKVRGYIANNGDLAGEFFSPYVPLDQGFSFYDAYAKIPIMEYEWRRILKSFEKTNHKLKKLNPDKGRERL